MSRHNSFLFAIILLISTGAPCALHAAEPAFRLKHLLISDTNAKVGSMKATPRMGRIILWDEPLLATDAFNQTMAPYFARPITPDSISRLTRDLTAFVRSRGQPLVYVSVPDQSIATGDLRLVVIVGRYPLKRLLISGSAQAVSDLEIPPNAGAIVVDNLPLIETRDFVKRCAPFFGQPITEDALNRLVAAIDGYVKARGQLLAKVEVPTQTISGGVFRIALVIGRYPLRRLVVADTAQHARAAPVPPGAGRVVATGVPQLATREFARYIAPYFGQPITIDSVDRLRTAVVDYLKRHDLAIVSVPEPTVDLATGEIRAAAIIGRYNELVFRGNRWFSDRLLQRQLGIKPGEEVRLSTLQNALNWANQNPFRHLQVTLNTINLPPGIADLDVSVAERVPVQVALSYDDAGNDVIGNNQYSASVLFGNLWGRDHQLSYQFTTTDALHLYQAQSLDYRAPLPWRHYLEFTAALADIRPTFYGGYGHEHNRNVVADLRYIAPVTLGTWSLEFSGGLDYKQVTNNFVFGDQEVSPSLVPAFTPYDVAQLTGRLTVGHPDRHGKWTAALSLNGSPGGLNHRNTDAVFNALHHGAVSDYVYGTLEVLRESDLPGDFQLFSRGELQLSSANLVQSEQLSIGGQATVRGYDERIVSGDQGWTITEELRGPLWNWRPPLLRKLPVPLATRPLVFWDCGDVYYKHPNGPLYDYPNGELESAGVGIRSNLAANFVLSADYGWQLRRAPVPEPIRSRGDLQVTIAY